MFHTSVIELSRKALQSNLAFLRDQIGPDIIHSSVIKGNAYGHGISNFVPVAQELGVDHFAVFSSGEALMALEARTGPCDIMIMGYVDDPELEWAIEHEISFYVFEFARLYTALSAAKRVGKPARIHLELETGMNRTGLEPSELDAVLELVLANPDHLHVVGVCTHFAGAESTANYWRIQRQIKRFKQITTKLKRKGLDGYLRHAASTAATFSYPTTRFEMVRSGILQYGYWPTRETLIQYLLETGVEEVTEFADPLQRVMRWRSRVMHTKTVKTGEYIGYGISYLTSRTTRIASVPIGYWHGFARALSNLGRVLIHGQRVPVIGTVNMNMILVDVTNLGTVNPGDEVVLIGPQGEHEISVASFAEQSNFLNYEVLVSLPAEIPRMWVE